MTIHEIVYQHWPSFPTYIFDGQEFFPGCWIICELDLRNITQVMNLKSKRPRISPNNWRREKLPEINPWRTVYLFSLAGIEEIIRNNHNNTCRRLQELLGPPHQPQFPTTQVA